MSKYLGCFGGEWHTLSRIKHLSHLGRNTHEVDDFQATDVSKNRERRGNEEKLEKCSCR